ncbi:MAG: hydroxymethylglutaryl-CoA lyase [Bacteroidota bacterium]
MERLKIIECPRDAMQGINEFIPTEKKIAYLNKLLETGFDTLDFGSFVSPKAVPQMRDTAEVLAGLDLTKTKTKLLAIVANLRGAKEASEFEQISYLGYPMSVSETFQYKNTNKTIVQSLEELVEISNLCQSSGKELVVYISMGFGNPYGDQYSPAIVAQFVDILISLGVSVISLADTAGMAGTEQVVDLFNSVKTVSEQVEWGVHLHASPDQASEKIKAAISAGCQRIDGAVLGYGGCPMADNELVGNINTRIILEVAEDLGIATGIDMEKFNEAEQMAASIF